jgi:hypothetical protein
VTEAARREYAAALRARYAGASRAEKGRILDEYCRTTGGHRKAAIRMLRREPTAARRGGRRPVYGPAFAAAVAELWELSDRLSGKLLVAALPAVVPALERHGASTLAPEIRAQVLGASAATRERVLRRIRQRRGRLPRRLVGADSTLRRQVPIRTWGEWAEVPPGALQGDLVLHCGESTSGVYLSTLVAVDVATSWTELQAIWGVGQHRVRSGVAQAHARVPMGVHAWHTDNGSEFLNHALLDYCGQHGLRVTRGRSYRKNDQAWVEQRNAVAVRRLVGHHRYCTRAAYAVLHRLYGLLRLQLNFFRPVRKVLRKQRRGSKIHKTYDRPQTPYQRVLAAGVLPAAQQAALEREYLAIDPRALTQQISHTLTTLWKLRDADRLPAEVDHG